MMNMVTAEGVFLNTVAAVLNNKKPSALPEGSGLLEKIHLSMEQWNSMKDENGLVDLPVWSQVTGNSMFPFIRAFRDEVMIVSLPKEEYKIGDIVLFPAKRRGGDYCLHRLYKVDGDRVQTFGDGCRYPDGWISKDRLLGKAVLIKRGNRTIDCESPKWIRRLRWWNRFWRIRPTMLLLLRMINKCKRIVNKA